MMIGKYISPIPIPIILEILTEITFRLGLKGTVSRDFWPFFWLKRFDLGSIWTGKNGFAIFQYNGSYGTGFKPESDAAKTRLTMYIMYYQNTLFQRHLSENKQIFKNDYKTDIPKQQKAWENGLFHLAYFCQIFSGTNQLFYVKVRFSI